MNLYEVTLGDNIRHIVAHSLIDAIILTQEQFPGLKDVESLVYKAEFKCKIDTIQKDAI